MPITFDHVCYNYDPKGTKHPAGVVALALEDICLEIPDGQFVGIIGHTGSGKSTLIQHMNGLLQPTQGKVLVNGLDLSQKAARKKVRRHVGIAFQYPEYQLFATTVAQDVAFGPKNLGCSESEVDQRVRASMERVGLDYDTFAETSPFHLSGGQQRRAALAGILAMEPDVLVLDEPMAGLDPKGRVDILEFVHSLHDDGMTIVMVSHSMEDVAENAERIIVMNSGKICMDGSAAEVFAHEEKLHEIGLDVPAATKFRQRLAQEGMDLPADIHTLDDLADALVKRLGTRTKEEFLATHGQAVAGEEVSIHG